MGFRVWGLGAWGLRFRVEGLGIRLQGREFGFWVEGLMVSIQGAWFRV